MEFGKLSSVDSIDWTLRAENPLTAPYLKSGSAPDMFQLYIGTPAWGHKEWVGRLYPPKTPASKFLYHYSRNFNCIELNTTHYRIPDETQVQKWTAQVPKGFLFCPKVTQSISHDPGGLQNKEELRLWFKSLNAFGENLGPNFLQLPPHFSYDRKVELFYFLKNWPAEFQLTLEFRHPSWFEDGQILEPLVRYLQSRNIGLVITDVAGRRDVLHSSISATHSILRFIGNDLHASDYTRIPPWIQKLQLWKAQGLKQFFFMIHEPDDIHAPEMANWIIEQINASKVDTLTPLEQPLLLN